MTWAVTRWSSSPTSTASTAPIRNSTAGAEPLRSLPASHPLLRERTSVDQGLAELLIAYGITAYVAGASQFTQSQLGLRDYLADRATAIYPE